MPRVAWDVRNYSLSEQGRRGRGWHVPRTGGDVLHTDCTVNTPTGLSGHLTAFPGEDAELRGARGDSAWNQSSSRFCLPWSCALGHLYP